MNSVQDRWVLAAIAVSECAWLHAILGVLALITQINTNPLNWFAMLGILGTSLVLSRLLQAMIIPTTVAYATQMLMGALVVYLVLGIQFSATLDLGWPGILNSEKGSDSYWFRASLAAMIAVGMWWRGGRIAASNGPEETLGTSFRVGVWAMAISIITDAVHPANLNVYPVLFVFTAASLTGLAISHLSSPSGQANSQATWHKIIGGLVAVVILLGVGAGLVENAVLPLVTNIAQTVIWFTTDKVIGPVVAVVLYPIVFAMDWFFTLIVDLLRTDLERQVEALPVTIPEIDRELQEVKKPAASRIIKIAGIFTITIVAFATLYFLARAFRQRHRGRYEHPEGHHESIKDGADPLLDTVQLLFNLLPDRLRKRTPRQAFRVPDGEPGVVEVFRIYYSLLATAERAGVCRMNSESPSEFEGKLKSLFQQQLVRKATTAFNRACYGHLPTSEKDLADLHTLMSQTTDR